MSRFCHACGKAVEEGATFCAGCGSKVRADHEAPPVAIKVASDAGTQTRKANKNFLPYVAGAVVAALGLVLCGGIYAAYRVSGKARHLTGKTNLEAILKSVSASPAGDGDTGENQAPKSAERDVCTLISKEEVANATGVSVSETSLNDEKDVCTYTPSEDGMVTVTIGVQWQNGKLAMRALPAMSKQLINEDMRQPVSGIGEEAYLLGVDKDTERQFQDVPKELRAFSSATTGPLVFRKGDVMVTVTATFAERKSDVEKKIAEIVAKRL